MAAARRSERCNDGGSGGELEEDGGVRGAKCISHPAGYLKARRGGSGIGCADLADGVAACIHRAALVQSTEDPTDGAGRARGGRGSGYGMSNHGTTSHILRRIRSGKFGQYSSQANRWADRSRKSSAIVQLSAIGPLR